MHPGHGRNMIHRATSNSGQVDLQPGHGGAG